MPSSPSRLFAIAIVVGLTSAIAPRAAAQTIGPDVTVNDLGPIYKWGSQFGITAYSFATQSCNSGDAEAVWIEASDQHPVIAQNVYRLRNGRFQQIGMSWLKHGFCALDEFDCGPCQANGDCNYLGINCADTYGSTLNGLQEGLGPRSDVNAATGAFPYPFSFEDVAGPLLFKRLQIADPLLNPVANPGARYFYEALYITPDEIAWGNQYNNASYRELEVGPYDNGYELAGIDTTVVQTPAIYAWQADDPGVAIEEVFIPGDGLVFVGARATETTPGTWHYEYAIYNYNSDRSIGRFAVSLPPGTSVTGTSFQDVHYHSGEPYSQTDWAVEVTANAVSWSTETYGANPNANALRWGTLYNFGFDCDVAPATSDLTLGLFKPGASLPAFPGVGPGQSPCTTPDFVRGNVNGDATVDISDAVYLLAFLFQSGAVPVPTIEAGDSNDDGGVDVSDSVYLLAYLFTDGPEPPAPFPLPGCE